MIKQNFTIRVIEANTFIIDSFPDGITNNTIPKDFTRGNISFLLNFIKFRQLLNLFSYG